ncbi:MAG: carbamoyltransferase HypF [Clostridiales Family XIII bacterium]|nr:carbamoyltransferase HypF [Clostridiales Family XIII bacterium]
MVTRVITIYGTVQGVGFRPTTSRYAAKFGMKGQVRNMGGLVQLILTDTPERIDRFLEYLIANKPRASEIIAVEQKEVDTVPFDGFSIVPSSACEDEIAILPADIAICDRCCAELRDEQNRRFGHPFISCTDCGPRFTIMERLPYDRDTTTMDDFALCGECTAEYADARGIRFHAQTVSCHDCGPQAIWVGAAELHHKNSLCENPSSAVRKPSDNVAEAAAALLSGGVIALKGVGGYYFACRAGDEQAVQRLRDIKLREEKPFAVMFADTDEIGKQCAVSEAERELLESPKRPIVLLERCSDSGLAPGVCGSSRFVGAFLPSMGLQYLLLDACGPLVMTSANLSGLPIITEDDEMLRFARGETRLSGILYNTRRIAAGADDSVVRVIDGKAQLIRRSKGYVPVPVYARGAARLTKDVQIYAAGGQLKSAFALSKGSFSYLSQYFGDIDSLESEQVYRENYARMKDFFSIEPEIVVCDMHPNYVPTRFAETAGRAEGKRLIRVQHHHAHIASVMAEHGLTGPVIGVAFDGTGYGTDGNIWGGEILICQGESFTRHSHLRYVRMNGGDSSMREGWKSALSYVAAARHRGDITDEIFDIDIADIIAYAETRATLADHKADRNVIFAAIEAGVNCVESSSMGRLFDAAASLLGIHHVNRYEGECAIMLENAADRSVKNPGASEADDLALAFHLRVAQATVEQCRSARENCGSALVALSGGVFQNKILMDETLKLLRRDGFRVYYNESVPPNDGGIALGQNYIGMLAAMKW